MGIVLQIFRIEPSVFRKLRGKRIAGVPWLGFFW